MSTTTIKVGLLCGVVALFMTGSRALANHYGTAGCGLGSLVFNDQPGKIQILAATTNNILVPQTSALTSGTSGCYEDDSREAAQRFIQVNEVALRKDISRGNGETLSHLSRIYHCQDVTALGFALQKNFGHIFPQGKTSATKVDQSILSTIRQDTQLTKNCQIFG